MRKALSVLLLIVLLAPAALAQSDEVVTIRVWGGWGHFRETTFQRVVRSVRRRPIPTFASSSSK